MPHLDLLAPGADLASIERVLPQTHRGAAMTRRRAPGDGARAEQPRRALRARHGRPGDRAHVRLPRRAGDRSRRRDVARLDRRRVREGRGHRRRARRHRERRAEARAHHQRPDSSRRRCRAAHDVVRQQRHASSSSSSPTARAARCACSGARRPPTRRASSRSGSRIRLADTPDEAPVVLVATQGQGDEDALERALRSSGEARADDCKPAQGGEAARP